MIQNATMLAAAQVIKRAKDAMGESGRLTRDLYWDNKFQFEDQVIVPVKEWNALSQALDDYEYLAEHENDAQDMDETEASFGADCKRQIIGGLRK